jgi:hypothetical protein
MFAEALHSMIKDIHLTLEVKTSFSNSTPMMGSSMQSNTKKRVLPLIAIISLSRKERRVGTGTPKSYKAKLE